MRLGRTLQSQGTSHRNKQKCIHKPVAPCEGEIKIPYVERPSLLSFWRLSVPPPKDYPRWHPKSIHSGCFLKSAKRAWSVTPQESAMTRYGVLDLRRRRMTALRWLPRRTTAPWCSRIIEVRIFTFSRSESSTCSCCSICICPNSFMNENDSRVKYRKSHLTESMPLEAKQTIQGCNPYRRVEQPPQLFPMLAAAIPLWFGLERESNPSMGIR